jgi:hypothetical protein
MSTIYGIPNVTTDGLVLCFDGNNRKCYPGSGSIVYDLSGNNNYGTLTSGATVSSGGLNFDGTDDYISITETSGMTPQVMTVDCWFKVNSETSTSYGGAPNSYQMICFRQNTRTSTYEGVLLAFTEPAFSPTYGAPNTVFIQTATAGGAASSAVSSANTIFVGNIYSSIAVIDTTTLNLYVNGTLAATSSKASGIDYNANHTFKLGRAVATGVSWDAAFNGTIYSLKIYNRALSAAEVRQNFNALRGRFGI